jgi:glycosyltransferase involved in cell wall biosynthesis
LQIGYVSRIDRGKGWEVLLEALSLLKGKGIDNFRCQLYGPGGDADMAALRVGIDELKLPGVVEYAGARPHHELPTVFRLLDIFVFPTTRESLGLVGLEAMACGVPVIGSRILPLEEYIVDGGNGFLFAPGNAQDLADKIEAFMRTSLTTRQEMRRQAVAMAKRYDRKTVACAMKARFVRM